MPDNTTRSQDQAIENVKNAFGDMQVIFDIIEELDDALTEAKGNVSRLEAELKEAESKVETGDCKLKLDKQIKETP